MGRSLIQKYPVHIDLVLFAEIGEGFIGYFVAAFDDREILWVQTEGSGNIPVQYLLFSACYSQHFSYTLHNVPERYHGYPFTLVL